MKLLMPSQQGRAADLGARLPILRKHGLSTAHDPLGPLEVRERHEHAAVAAAEHDLADLVVGQRGPHDDDGSRCGNEPQSALLHLPP